MEIFQEEFQRFTFVVEDQVLVRRLLHTMGYDLLEPIHDQFKSRLKEKGVSLDP